MRQAERGYQLIELLIAMAISSLVLALGVPPLLSLAAGLRVELAAAEVASTFHVARGFAIRHSANVGLKFEVAADGTVTWALYRDGDGDGVLTADIRAGDDPQVLPPSRLTHLDDPIRFNNSNIASFSALGTATPGTVYLTDGMRHLSAARVTGRTGRIDRLSYDVASEQWH